MKRIKKFGDFDDLDFISESRVYFMNDLVLKLREIRDEQNNEWASKLLKSQGKDIDSDTTFLELDGDNFSFSKEEDVRKFLVRVIGQEDIDDFFSDDRVNRPIVNNYVHHWDQHYLQRQPNRGRVKMGRIIKKLIPEIPDKDLESLVNNLRSEQTGYEMKLVKGDEIAKYYKSESCDPKLYRYGTLQSSCMTNKAEIKPYIFDIYTKNPDSCQLLVMLNSNGQLMGRALVWTVDEIAKWDQNKNEEFYSNFDVDWQRQQVEPYDNHLIKGKTKNLFFMDRVYYTKEWISNAFHKWARDNNFMIKIGESISYKGKVASPTLFVKVNKIAYRQFPYMDTFKNYDVQSGTLCNYEVNYRGFNLGDTQGGYSTRGSGLEKTIDKATNYIRRFKDYLG